MMIKEEVEAQTIKVISQSVYMYVMAYNVDVWVCYLYVWILHKSLRQVKYKVFAVVHSLYYIHV